MTLAKSFFRPESILLSLNGNLIPDLFSVINTTNAIIRNVEIILSSKKSKLIHLENNSIRVNLGRMGNTLFFSSKATVKIDTVNSHFFRRAEKCEFSLFWARPKYTKKNCTQVNFAIFAGLGTL
jgi:hypothetical protein